MADIRQNTAVLDDFNRADGPPGANWSTVDTAVWSQMEIDSNTLTHKTGEVTSHSYWNADGPFDHDDCEAWGWAVGGNAGGAAWGIGLMRDFGSNSAEGYRFRNAIGGASDSDWLIERFTNGARTIIATNTTGHANGDFFMLIRRKGSSVEGWWSLDGDDWDLAVSVTDTSYTGNLWMTLASSDNSLSQLCDWDYFGGGPKTTWMPEFIRRPWETQTAPPFRFPA